MASRTRVALALAIATVVLTGGGLALSPAAARAGSVLTGADDSVPVPISISAVPAPGHHLSAQRVLAIASRLPAMRRVASQYPGSYPGVYEKGATRWQVSFFASRRREVGQVLIADRSGRVLEQWTGFQVAWPMARGYPGAFGEHSNALYVWLPLCLLFLIPFVDWRRPLRLLHLDLAMLLAFSVSLAFFNHADIGMSVPLVYPPLLYLLARMLALARRRRAPAPTGPRPPLRLAVPVRLLTVGTVLLVAFRVALNVSDSNVIDVGYAGVIGAHRIVHGQSLYGGWPADNRHGDTYGPVSYEAYVPFLALFGWSGHWDTLPAAHAATIVFDLLALVLMFLLGRRVRGPALGVALAYAWASYPFTLFALESNSNDSLVAALILVAVFAAGSTRARSGARGVLSALAGLAKFAPLALAPLLACHGHAGDPPRRRARAVAVFAAAFCATAVLLCVPAVTHGSLARMFSRTLIYQADRGSPFSVWGLYGGLWALQFAVGAAAVALALGLALLPRRDRDLPGLAAAAAAILIAVQLAVGHWFYLYIPWFFGLAMLALLGTTTVAGGPDALEANPAAASAAARSRQLAAV